MTRAGADGWCGFINFDGGGHGQEESEEGKKGGEKEEKESGRPKSKGKVRKESRQEDGAQEEVCAEKGGWQETSPEHADEGARGPRDRDHRPGPVHGGDAGGEDGAESRRSLALSDGLEALSGQRMNCGQSEGLRLRTAPQNIRQREKPPERAGGVGQELD